MTMYCFWGCAHLPTLAGDVVAAAVLLDGTAALGAELSVGNHPVLVLALSDDLHLPLRPPAGRDEDTQGI